MSLFISTVIQAKDEAVDRSQLFNNKKIIQFRTNSDGNTAWEYKEREDDRTPPFEYITEYSRAAFEGLAREADNEPFIWINILNNKAGQACNEMVKFAVDRIVTGYDQANATRCLLWIEEGAWRVTKYLTSHTITEISQAASQSISLSPST